MRSRPLSEIAVSPLAARAAIVRARVEPATGRRWWRHDALWVALHVLYPRWALTHEIAAVFALVTRRPEMGESRGAETPGRKIRAQLSNFHAWGWADRIGKRRRTLAGRRRLPDGRLVPIINPAEGVRYRVRRDAEDLL